MDKKKTLIEICSGLIDILIVPLLLWNFGTSPMTLNVKVLYVLHISDV